MAPSRTITRCVTAALLFGSAGAAKAQSCVGLGPDATRCRFVLGTPQTLNVLARAYLQPNGGAPSTDMRIEIDGRACFEARARPGFIQGPPIGRCRVRLEASRHAVVARILAKNALLKGVGVELRADDRLSDIPDPAERSTLWKTAPR